MAILSGKFVLGLLVLASADAFCKYFNWAGCNLLIRGFVPVLGNSSVAAFPPFVPLAEEGSKCQQHVERFLRDLKNLELWALKSEYYKNRFLLLKFY